MTAIFKNAFRARGNPSELTFHSDQGGQYTSDTFFKLLQQDGVKQSFSRSGRPCDNAVAETFFASFRREEAYRRDYSSEADFRKSVDEYVHFYNEQRPHQTLAYKSLVRLRNFMDRKRHRLVRKPVSKKCTWTNIFLQLVLIFRNTPQATFQKIQLLQRLQSKAEPPFDIIVQKTTPLQPFSAKIFDN